MRAIELARRAARSGREARPRGRQLRLLHLQPRAVPGRAGGGGRGRAQRRVDGRRAARRARATASSSRPGRARPTRRASRSSSMRRFPEAGVPTLGVCLGHQSLGAGVRRHGRAPVPVHGKTTEIEHDGTGCSPGLPIRSTVGALPLAGGRSASCPRLELDRAGRRRPDGDPPPRAARARASSSTPSPCSPRRQGPAGDVPCLPVLTRRSTRWPAAGPVPRQTRRRLAEIMGGNA